MKIKPDKTVSLWTALVTPMFEDGVIDWASLESLLRQQERAGNGVVLLGSTGEGLAIEESEKRTMLERACALNLTTPLMVGVGGFNLSATLQWLEFCERLPLAGYLMVTPLYAKPGVRGQTAWFSRLLDAVKKPCMLYNIPSRAGCALAVSAVKELASHPHFWAIKESSGSLNEFQAYREAAPEVAMYSGEDGLMPFLASAGACGLVSVMANAWPEATREYVKRSLAGEHEGLMPFWAKASASLFATSNPVPVKALLHDKGWIATPCVRPPLCHRDLTTLEGVRLWDRKVQEWSQSFAAAALA